MAKDLKHFYIRKDQSEWLRKEANKRNISQASIIRKAIDEYKTNNLKTSINSK